MKNGWNMLSSFFSQYDYFIAYSTVEYKASGVSVPAYYGSNINFYLFNDGNFKLYNNNGKLTVNTNIPIKVLRLSYTGTPEVISININSDYNRSYFADTTNFKSRCITNYDKVIYTNSSLTTTDTGYNSVYNTGVSLIKWQFTPAGTSTVIYGGNGWNYYRVNAGWSTYLGSITDSEWVSKIKYRYAYYDTSLKTFSSYGNYITIYDYNTDGVIWHKFAGSTTNNNGTYTTGIYLKTNNLQNYLLQLVIESGEPDTLPTIYTDYILENTYTYVSGGVFYPSLTFSGDYGNDYNQQNQDNIIQENHDDTINTITDDSQVDGLIDDFLNSGDLLNSIGGYNYFENPFIAFVEDLADSFVDVLTGSNNASISINWRGTNYTFHGSDFALPSGTLKTFISAICNAFFVWGLIKYGYQLYEWIRTGRIQNWLNNTSSGNIEDYFLF